MRSLVVAVSCLLACGDGGSDVPPEALFVDLDDAQVMELCQHLVDQRGPDRAVTCADGEITVTGATVAECIETFGANQTQFPDCPLTVEQLETCGEALAARTDDQICNDPLPDICVVTHDAACGT
jgi:hypothetical protein